MSVAPSAVAAPPSRFQQFYALTKPRVVQLIVFCALIGMVLAVPGLPNAAQLGHMALACLGVWLVAGAAAAFNCIVEQGIDAKMKRTAGRPILAAIDSSTPPSTPSSKPSATSCSAGRAKPPAAALHGAAGVRTSAAGAPGRGGRAEALDEGGGELAGVAVAHARRDAGGEHRFTVCLVLGIKDIR